METRKKGTPKHMHPALVVALDLVLLGAVLVVYALFHHAGQALYSQYRLSQQPVNTTAVVTEPPKTTPVPTTPGPTLPEQTLPPETTPEPDLRTPWQIQFEEHFSEQVEITPNSYRSPNVSVTIDTVTTGEGYDLITYYVADIYVASPECLRTYPANNELFIYGTQMAVDMDKASGAVIALSGDFYKIQKNSYVLRNGQVYSNGYPHCDLCVYFRDGSMATYLEGQYSKDEISLRDPVHIWNFGPALLDEEGKARTSFQLNEGISGKHPRSAIGYYEPGHYCFVLADGRDWDHSIGMRMTELAQLFEDLGCVCAYNLDGGASAALTFQDELYNQPVKTREISDVIIIVEPEELP